MAAAAILGILLKVDDQASRSLNGMQGAVGNLATGIQQHHRAIGVAMAAMGAAIIGVGIMSIKTYAQMGDEVHKMALRTGFAAGTLSEFRHVAEISGASLDNIELSVKKMSKSLLDADRGLETYARSFREIGLNIDELMQMKPEEQFEAIAMAIAGLENQTQKAAIAQEIFGRSGTALLPMLAAGADGIAELRQEAHDLGIVFDQEAANKAAKFTDDMTRLKRSVDGVKMGIAEALIPTLTPLIEKFTSVISSISDWMSKQPTLTSYIILAGTAFGALSIAAAPLLIFLPSIASGFHLVAAGIIAVKAAGIIAIAVSIAAMAQVAAIAAAGLISIAIGFTAIMDAIKGREPRLFHETLQDWKRGIEDVIDGLLDTSGIMKDVDSVIADVTSRIEGLDTGLSGLEVGIDNSDASLDSFMKSWEDFLKTTSTVAKEFQATGLTVDEVLRGWAVISDQTKEQIVADLME